MNIFQLLFVVAFGVYALWAALLGYYKTNKKNNPFGLCYWFNPISAFVWADAIVFGTFFFLVSALTLYLQDFLLFLLIFFVFWTVRSIGEQVYWFLEQFATNHRNPPHTLWANRHFPGGSVWVSLQIFWQCISVIGIIMSVYLFSLWI